MMEELIGLKQEIEGTDDIDIPVNAEQQNSKQAYHYPSAMNHIEEIQMRKQENEGTNDIDVPVNDKHKTISASDSASGFDQAEQYIEQFNKSTNKFFMKDYEGALYCARNIIACYKELKLKYTNIEKKYQQLAKQLDNEQKQKYTLIGELAVKKINLTELHEKNQQLEKEHAELSKTVHDRNVDNAQLRQELETVRNHPQYNANESDSSAAELNEELIEKVRMLEEENQSLRSEILYSELKYKALGEDVSGLEKQNMQNMLQMERLGELWDGVKNAFFNAAGSDENGEILTFFKLSDEEIEDCRKQAVVNAAFAEKINEILKK